MQRSSNYPTSSQSSKSAAQNQNSFSSMPSTNYSAAASKTASPKVMTESAASGSPNLLQIRTELFEHGLFPMQSKLTSNVLVTTFTNLNLLSSIDYKIKLANWVD